MVDLPKIDTSEENPNASLTKSEPESPPDTPPSQETKENPDPEACRKLFLTLFEAAKTVDKETIEDLENQPTTSTSKAKRNSRKRAGENLDLPAKKRTKTQKWCLEKRGPDPPSSPESSGVAEDEVSGPAKITKEEKEALLKSYIDKKLPAIPDAVRDDDVGVRYYGSMVVYIQARKENPSKVITLSPKCHAMAFVNFKKDFDEEKKFIEENSADLGPSQKACRFCSSLDEKGHRNYTSIFQDRSKLNRHIRTHFEQKDLVCGVCAVMMNSPTDMLRHILTHTDIRPYSCKICEMTFVQKVSLDEHMKNKHSMRTKTTTRE